MHKKTLLFVMAFVGMTLFSCYDCAGASKTIEDQPSVKETKHLEHSLDIFSQKMVSKNKIMNMQYKRYGKQAVLSFDVIKPNEVMLMLYLLEYSHGEWRIAREYHYAKTVVPSAAACA